MIALRAMFFSIVLLTSPALGFGLHYLITDRALPTDDPSLDRKIATETLDDFLHAESKNTADLFAEYYRWLAEQKSRRFVVVPFDTKRSDTVAFLAAARLNPTTKFWYLTRLLPGQKASGATVPLRQIAHYGREQPGIDYLFENTAGREVTAHSILITFSDEPDWGMDNDLWSYPQYGYGKQPYGKATGVSNQAPFHCQYAHENLIVRFAAPEVMQGMARERLELATRLARLAFRTGHPYWGYRFTAWAMHYLEDLGQPYHARAVPFADWRYYLKFLFSSHKEQMKTQATQVVINHHDLYEDFVQWLMQESYRGDTRGQPLADALGDRSADWRARELGGLFGFVTRWSSGHAAELDRAVRAAFDWAEAPDYDLEADPSYHAAEILSRTDDRKSRALRAAAIENLRQVGRATRALLHYCRKGLVPRELAKDQRRRN